MDEENLKDFRPDESDFEPDPAAFENNQSSLSRNGYHEEANTIKIDKLSNKITIISIIIPVMIGVILIFAYLDIKERVVDVDQTKQTQVENISHQLEEKLNALDVKIAKNKFEIDKALPVLQKKTTALEGQMAKLSSTKADTRTVNDQLSKLGKQVKTNTSQDEATMAEVDKINKATLTRIKANQEQFDRTSKKIKEEITLFKEEFDARLLELSDYEQQIGRIRKDQSLLDKKFAKLEQGQLKRAELQTASGQLQDDMAKLKNLQDKQIQNLKIQLSGLEKKLASQISNLSKQIDQMPIQKKEPPKKPVPQVKIETPPESGILKKPLK